MAHARRANLLSLLMLATLLSPGARTYADEIPVAPDSNSPSSDTRSHEPEADSHPILSANAIWAGVAAIIIIGLFLAAAVIGPVVRAEYPDEVPPAFSHEEDPAHHAGKEHAIWEKD